MKLYQPPCSKKGKTKNKNGTRKKHKKGKKGRQEKNKKRTLPPPDAKWAKCEFIVFDYLYLIKERNLTPTTVKTCHSIWTPPLRVFGIPWICFPHPRLILVCSVEIGHPTTLLVNLAVFCISGTGSITRT